MASLDNILPFKPDGTELNNTNRGYFSKSTVTHKLDSDENSNMYYNGDFYCARVFNAVWNDYAEKFYSPKPLKAGEILATSTVYIGVCTESYGRCLGKGNTAICMTGRVPLKVGTSKLKGGEFLYWNNGKIGIVKEWNEKTIANKIGKVLYVIDKSTAMILV